jgi:ribonuclease HI
MSPSTNSIKTEVNHAVASGIRKRGPEAVGVVLVGMARLTVNVSALVILLLASAVFGYGITASHAFEFTAVIAALNWLVTGNART